MSYRKNGNFCCIQIFDSGTCDEGRTCRNKNVVDERLQKICSSVKIECVEHLADGILCDRKFPFIGMLLRERERVCVCV